MCPSNKIQSPPLKSLIIWSVPKWTLGKVKPSVRSIESKNKKPPYSPSVASSNMTRPVNFGKNCAVCSLYVWYHACFSKISTSLNGGHPTWSCSTHLAKYRGASVAYKYSVWMMQRNQRWWEPLMFEQRKGFTNSSPSWPVLIVLRLSIVGKIFFRFDCVIHADSYVWIIYKQNDC